MPTRYLYCTAPDGTILRRRTQRDYSYAVCVAGRDGVWEATSWSASLQGAYKARNGFQRLGYDAVITEARTTA